MAKLVGLSRENKKYLKVIPFPKGTLCAGTLYVQAKSFYQVFRIVFNNGFQTILGHKIPNMENLGACLVNYHFSIELMLKGIICLKNKVNNARTHDLVVLLKEARILYPDLSRIENNAEHMFLLRELSDSFDLIRYGEGTICLSHNKKKGWKTKAPLQELSEILEEIFNILCHAFECNRPQR